MSKTFSEAQIEEKVKTLSAKYGVAVYPIVFLDNGAQLVGYLKEPNRETKFRVLDMSVSQPWSVGRLLLETCLIKEESDHRFYSEAPEHDDIILGAAHVATETITYKLQQYKKK